MSAILGVLVFILVILLLNSKEREKKISKEVNEFKANEKELLNNLENIKLDINKQEDNLKQLNLFINNKESEKQKIIDEAIEEAKRVSDEKLKELQPEIYDLISQKDELINLVEQLQSEESKLNKNIVSAINKLDKAKLIYKSYKHVIDNYINYTIDFEDIILPDSVITESEEIAPSVLLRLNSMNVKELNKLFKQNDKLIEEVFSRYQTRYNTKSNAAIYKLMVIALRAELQNVLTKLKYDKLDNAIEEINIITNKYLTIASDGNQSIAPTLVKFIGEIDDLFKNAVNIEYEYYVKKEQARLEQQAIREQMRQEAEERKELERQKQQLEKEESKYQTEIQNIMEQLKQADEEKQAQLEARIKELEAQVKSLEDKKEEIINLQNGKAGNIYIISNLGSFGEDVFKIGMTRRLDPMDRVKELGDASVPFSFDVHAMIFSEDAPALENSIHKRLDKQRVNMINSRKEFFRCSIDELEQLVDELNPGAEFNRTMIADEYRQSQEIIKSGKFLSELNDNDIEE